MLPDFDEATWTFAGLAPESGLLFAEASFRFVQNPIKGN